MTTNPTLPAPVVHNLKTWPIYFDAVERGVKNFEVRLNDRDFQEGDLLRLQEFDPATCEYSGAELTRVVTFVLDGGGEDAFGLAAGNVVMGLAVPAPAPGQMELPLGEGGKRVLAILEVEDGITYSCTSPRVEDDPRDVKEWAATLRRMATSMTEGYKRGKARERLAKQDAAITAGTF